MSMSNVYLNAPLSPSWWGFFLFFVFVFVCFSSFFSSQNFKIELKSQKEKMLIFSFSRQATFEIDSPVDCIFISDVGVKN